MIRQELRLTNTEITELMAKNRQREPLSHVNRLNLNALYARSLLGWQRDYFLLQEGILTENMFMANLAVMKANFRGRTKRLAR